MKLKLTLVLLPLLCPFLSHTQYLDGENQHTIILTSDSSVWTIGKNEYGELGNGTPLVQNTPVEVTGLGKAEKFVEAMQPSQWKLFFQNNKKFLASFLLNCFLLSMLFKSRKWKGLVR